MGLSLANANSENLARYGLDEESTGVIIVEVDPDGSAAQRGLREGDLIKKVDQIVVSNPDDVIAAVEDSRNAEKESVLMLVERNKQSRFVVVPTKA